MGSLKALITGVTGQDGSYLAEYLLGRGYEVYGLVRRTSNPASTRISHLLKDVHVLDGDLLDQSSLDRAVKTSMPDEVYNLAAQSFVGGSWAQPTITGDITGLGAARVFEAVRNNHPGARVYQASTSELYGSSPPQQDENTPFKPLSPYAIAKLYAHWMAVNYRKSYGMHISCGILFNHESPRRGVEFVTRKITKAAANIAHGGSDKLRLGNLAARRDWGYAGDYVRAMWMMLQRDAPEDYVVATGVMHSVEEFCQKTFEQIGMDYKDYVVVDPALYRPVDVNELCGNPMKANTHLGWRPTVGFDDMLKMMVLSDLKLKRDDC